MTGARKIGPEAGTTLLELMMVVALISMVAVMTAPMERYLSRQLAQADQGSAASWERLLSRAALRGDARQARAVAIEGGTRIRFTLPDRGQVVWSNTEEGLTRRNLAARGMETPARRYAHVSLVRAATPRPNLLELTLQTRDGQRHLLAVWLRNSRRSR